jgi:hypothetical protein
MFDIWFDGESVEPKVIQSLQVKLQEAFNLPSSQASVLVNGKSHRIKRGCTANEAHTLADQFTSWGAAVRIESVDQPSALQQTAASSAAAATPTSSLTLAAAGETIHTQPRDITPPSVSTDHLQLEDPWSEGPHCE